MIDRVAVGDLNVILSQPQLVQLLVSEASKLREELENVLGPLEDLYVEILA